MKTLFEEIDNTTYKGVTTEEYHKAIKDYSKAMFDLFDTDNSYGNSNMGMHLMWLGSWTSKFIAREVVDYSIGNKQPLNISLIEVLKLNNQSKYGENDLNKIKDIMLSK